MSTTRVYHYPHRDKKAHKRPREYHIDNGSAFTIHINSALGLTGPTDVHTIQRTYNQLLQNGAPEWQRIIGTFASQGTYILDEDRKKVGNALQIAEAKLELPFSQLSGLVILIDALPKGMIAVDGHSVCGCSLSHERGKRTVWYSQNEIMQKYLRAAMSTAWTYPQHL